MTKLDQVKNRAQFFKQGSIIPTRVLRCSKRREQHKLKFGSDSWVIPTKTGYLVIMDSRSGYSAIRINAKKFSATLAGSPYHKGNHGTEWLGNSGISDSEQEKSVLDALARMNGDAL